MMRRITVFLKNGLLLTFSSFFLRMIGFFFNVYLANKIGAEAVGVFQLVMSVYLFGSTFALSGIHLACMRLVSEELAYGLEGNIAKVVKKSLLYSVCFGTAACLLLIFLAPTLSTYWLHAKISCWPFYIMALSLPFTAMSSCFNGYFCAVRRVGKNAFASFIEQIVQVLVTSFFLQLFLPNSIDFACLSLVLGTTISEMLSFAVNLLLYRQDKKRYDKGSFAPSAFTKRILSISLPIAMTSYIRSGLSTLKQLLIPDRLEKSGLSCKLALENYGMINGMVMPILFFPSTFINSFSNLLIPEFSFFHTRGENQKMNQIVARILKYTFVFSFCVAGIFWCFSEQLSNLIYQNNKITLFLKLLSPLVVFMYVDTIIDSILKGLDKQVGVMLINILDLVLSIFCIFFLLPRYGIYGYLFVLFMSEILNFSLSLIQLFHTLSLPFHWKEWIFYPILACLSATFLFHLLPGFSSILWVSTILQILVFTFFYFFFLFCNGTLSKKDISFYR